MNVIFLGPPGAGKGTVASKVRDDFGFEHLSTGDMLREEMKTGTELGKKAKDYVDAGQLVPDELIIGMVNNRLEQAKAGILFDGFPRTVEQAKALDKIADIGAVVNLDIALNIVVDRICSRRMCRDCGGIHNTHWGDTDRCPKCGGELYIRNDDNEETVTRRYQVYTEQTAPLIDYYSAKNLVHTINADDTVESIEAQVRTVLQDSAE